MTLRHELAWGKEHPKKPPITLSGIYPITWSDYSELPDSTGGRFFRFLILSSAAVESDPADGVVSGTVPGD